MDISQFASNQLKLLEAELAAELEETSLLLSKAAPKSLQRAGLAIGNLLHHSQRTGLGGKTIIELVLDPATTGENRDIPEHGIRVGDHVLMSEKPAASSKKREAKELEDQGSRGVVTKVLRQSISVALDADDDDDGIAALKKIWLVKVANDATHKRWVS